MNVHDALLAALGSLVGGRYWPNRFPQEVGNPTWPAIRGTVVSGDNEVDQCGAGEFDEEDLRVQLDVVGESYDATEALNREVASTLAALSPAFIRQPGRFETWDAEAKVHRFTTDYLLQQSTPADSP